MYVYIYIYSYYFLRKEINLKPQTLTYKLVRCMQLYLQVAYGALSCSFTENRFIRSFTALLSFAAAEDTRGPVLCERDEEVGILEGAAPAVVRPPLFSTTEEIGDLI
jgi:hypothetical protein